MVYRKLQVNYPTKRYQVWYESDGGFHFEDFDTTEEVAVRLCGDNPRGRVFVTELQELSVWLGRRVPSFAKVNVDAQETL